MITVLAFFQATTYTLPIGRPGQSTVAVNEVRDMRTDEPSSVEKIAEAAKGYRFVYIGESHDNPHHHQMQADVIEALAKSGRDVAVGFEMFTRPVQKSLNPWTLGMYTKEEFIREADWKGQWGFPFEIYEPIFNVTKKYRLPMIALNVPRDWVRSVGRGGYEGLTAEQKAQLPGDFFMGNKEHRKLIESMMGGHPMTGTQGENMYKAQTLWDEGMADTAIKYMNSRVCGPETVFVVVAGSGHMMYGQGINFRVKRRTGLDGMNVTCIESKDPIKVARGLGDFVYCSPEVERKGG